MAEQEQQPTIDQDPEAYLNQLEEEENENPESDPNSTSGDGSQSNNGDEGNQTETNTEQDDKKNESKESSGDSDTEKDEDKNKSSTGSEADKEGESLGEKSGEPDEEETAFVESNIIQPLKEKGWSEESLRENIQGLDSIPEIIDQLGNVATQNTISHPLVQQLNDYVNAGNDPQTFLQQLSSAQSGVDEMENKEAALAYADRKSVV